MSEIEAERDTLKADLESIREALAAPPGTPAQQLVAMISKLCEEARQGFSLAIQQAQAATKYKAESERLNKFFESVTCLCVEGVEFMPASAILGHVLTEARKALASAAGEDQT